MNRFDAGAEWLRRRFAVSEKDRCPVCQNTGRRTERAACWRTARHVAHVYALGDGDWRGQSVRAAAYVVEKLERDTIRPVEDKVERMVAVRQRLGKPKYRYSKYVPTTGAQ